MTESAPEYVVSTSDARTVNNVVLSDEEKAQMLALKDGGQRDLLAGAA